MTNRDIWNYNRLSLQKGEDLDSLNYLNPKPSKKHIFNGKAYCFSPTSNERYDEIISWCHKNLSEVLISHDIENHHSIIIWIPNNIDVILFKLTHVKADPNYAFKEQMKQLGLME
jgi:hypothetical protein